LKKKRKIRKHRIDDDDEGVLDMTNPRSIFGLKCVMKLNKEDLSETFINRKKLLFIVAKIEKAWKERKTWKEKKWLKGLKINLWLQNWRDKK